MELVDHVRETLRPFKGSKLVVAVSGGLDSAALLDVLLQVREELELTLIVAHADHGLRRASVKDAEFVRNLAAAHSLPYTEAQLNVKKASNVEERAREARYKWLEQVRKKRQADFIVTAHQADDQVETLFLHLARGSGLQGLSGMQLLNGKILRPLLDIPRKTLTRYVRKQKLKYRRDATNRDVKFARNRVRRQVITSLQKINPQLVETVSQSMRVFSDQYGVIQLLAARELAQVSGRVTGTTRHLDRKKLLTLDRAVRHLVWREAVRELVGDVRGFTLRHFENLDELLSLQTGSLIHLPRGLTARRQYDEVVLRIGQAATPPKSVNLSVPGRVMFGELTVTAELVKSGELKTNPQAILVDAEAIGKTLRVRPSRAGDRFKPAGMRGSKLVSDLLTDAKIPRDERAWVPVITTTKRPRAIVWVGGYRADRRFAAGEDSKVLLKVNP
ncbi:tRNA lysidine(34) synthetase TilS [Patescibacteria group bacterium]|nr:tRNA lysidine(34) synthetase TilS [Patescibacteria group bacterium]